MIRASAVTVGPCHLMMEGSELDADQKKLLLKQQKQQKEEMWLKKLRAQKDKGC